MVELNPEDTFLNSIRNAFILLIAGIGLYEFGGRLSKMAVVILILVVLLLASSLYNYWTNPDRSSKLGIIPWIILALLGITIWLVYESWTNPHQLFELSDSKNSSR